ncbi:hypothetical protein D3C85_1602720 [compost metagenome]
MLLAPQIDLIRKFAQPSKVDPCERRLGVLFVRFILVLARNGDCFRLGDGRDAVEWRLH